MGFSFLITRQKPKTQNTCTIMKDDKDPFGSWIRIGMLGLASSWVVDQKRYWSATAHHTHYPTVRVLLAAVAIS